MDHLLTVCAKSVVKVFVTIYMNYCRLSNSIYLIDLVRLYSVHAEIQNRTERTVFFMQLESELLSKSENIGSFQFHKGS